MGDEQATRLLELRGALWALVCSLNADETEALTFFADKLVRGKIKHGPLDLATDRRDFAGAETREELTDAAFYLIFDAIRRGREQSRRAEQYPDADEFLDERDVVAAGGRGRR